MYKACFPEINEWFCSRNSVTFDAKVGGFHIKNNPLSFRNKT
jgi:hypothetical protein